jgi:hypothetical protein
MKYLLLALPLLAVAPDRPDPKDCSVCHNQRAKMARLRVENHGDFRFGRSDSKIVEMIFEDKLPIFWIEGQHVKLGFAATDFPLWPGGSDPDNGSRRSKELRSLANGALAEKPFARTHRFLERAEETYARVQELLQVEDSDFPRLDIEGKPVQPKGAPSGYMGEGPYLGQAAKYELLFLPSFEEYNQYMLHPNGLAGETMNQALIKDTDAISTVLHLANGEMWNDQGVWGYMVHYLAHALIRGYKHDSYALPAWLDAGFAHAIEREVNPTANSFCGSAEVATAGTDINNWAKEIKSILRKRHAPYFEPLFAKEELVDFTLEDHLIAWSMVRFLIEKHPKEFALINGDLHGISKSKRAIGVIAMRHAQQDTFARHLDMTYDEFDKAWSKWAKRLKGQR